MGENCQSNPPNQNATRFTVHFRVYDGCLLYPDRGGGWEKETLSKQVEHQREFCERKRWPRDSPAGSVAAYVAAFNL